MPVLDDLKAACSSVRVHEPLAKYTSFNIGGPADYYAEVNTVDELIQLRKVSTAHHLPVFFLGAGSNLLVSDKGIRGLVIHLQGDFKRIEFKENHVTVGAGAMMPTLSKQAAEHGLSGVEAMIGIPGTIGGGLIMNAGTVNGWLGTRVQSVQALGNTLRIEKISSQEAEFDYRHSALEGKWIIGAELLLEASDSESVLARIDEIMKYRTQTQPLTVPNCGSVFKNPLNSFAARWIENAGLKGTRFGGACVSERHANFIINDKGAKASDVDELMRHIQKKVLTLFDVRLEPEVKKVGEW